MVFSQTRVYLRSKICAFNKTGNLSELYEWDASNEVLEEVKMICDATVIQQNFVVQRSNVDNALATIDANGNRVIYYSEAFFQTLNNKAYEIAILAHEIGHHLNNNSFSRSDRSPTDELQADEFAGSILCKLGYTLEDAKNLLTLKCPVQGDGFYPPRSARIEAFITGYLKAGCATSETKNPDKQSIFTVLFKFPTRDRINNLTSCELYVDGTYKTDLYFSENENLIADNNYVQIPKGRHKIELKNIKSTYERAIHNGSSYQYLDILQDGTILLSWYNFQADGYIDQLLHINMQ